MIEFSNLTMRFGSLVAVDDLSLKVEQGEFFACLGPNGAGKTTTIKMLTGLLKPMEGHVKICGIDIQAEPEAAKAKLGYVPDIAVFYEKLTALEFMDFTADIFGVDPMVARTNTADLFTRFGLDPYARELIETLSHGTRQRLAIAAALMHDPEVIIIDEPMVGLDPIHAKVIKDELKARSKARRKERAKKTAKKEVAKKAKKKVAKKTTKKGIKKKTHFASGKNRSKK